MVKVNGDKTIFNNVHIPEELLTALLQTLYGKVQLKVIFNFAELNFFL
jgi:hypothetical protein